MRVGVYIDGYNLYYGGRACCSRGSAGWRWLDLRALSTALVVAQRGWTGARIERIVYCTARVDAVTNPSGHRDQDVYLKALLATSSVDHIQYGNYVARIKKALVATEDPRTHRPAICPSGWPLMVQDAHGGDVHGARFMVSYLHMEEKGSDVNVAAHMLIDVLSSTVDAAVVISNDSDLGFPIKAARERVPIGLVNPRPTYFAGDLAGAKSDGAGNHWWRKLGKTDYIRHQLADPANGFTKPPGW